MSQHSVRLLLDEHISPRVSFALREQQHVDALAVGGTEPGNLLGASDQTILEYAAKQKRVVVSYNYADFAVLHKEWVLNGIDHSGIVLLARGKIPTGNCSAQIKVLASFASKQMTPANQLIWIP
jgi:predicted nuclease of predicted toxin-antitoxin system